MKKSFFCGISVLAGMAIGAELVRKKMKKMISNEKAMSNKHLELFLMMNQWVKMKQKGKTLASYFEQNGYKKIAIYGISYAGETLLEELRETEIKVVYGIDKNADKIYTDVDIFSMEDSLENVDAVVVTAITFFEEIKEKLREKVSCPIVSLEDILYEV